MKKNNVIVAVAAAVVATGALYFLFKTDKGKKLTKKAKEKGKDMLSKVGTIVNDMKSGEPKEKATS